MLLYNLILKETALKYTYNHDLSEKGIVLHHNSGLNHSHDAINTKCILVQNEDDVKYFHE